MSFEYKEFPLTIDLVEGNTNQNANKKVYLSQRDIGSSKIILSLTFKGAVYPVPETAKLRFFVKRYNGGIVMQDDTIETESHVNVIDPTNGKIEILLNNDTIAVPGQAEAQLEIELTPGKIMTSQKFNFFIDTALGASANLISGNDIPLLDKAIEAGRVLSSIDLVALVEFQNNIDALEKKSKNTLTELKTKDLSNLSDGDIVTTNGYYSPGDGGQAFYIVDNSYMGVFEGGDIVTVGTTKLRLMYLDKINVKWFGARTGSTYGTDFTNALIKIKEYAVTKDKKVIAWVPFDRTGYYLRQSFTIDPHYIAIHSDGATIDVTKVIDDNAPYVFNPKYDKSKLGNMTERVTMVNAVQGIFFNSSYTTFSALKTKDTILFNFEVPLSEKDTHSSSDIPIGYIAIRNIPYFFTFGRNGYLNEFNKVSGRLCRSAVKIYGWNDQTFLNNTKGDNGFYQDNWGENITFKGGQFGGACEEVITNNMAIGSLNFIGVSIDYSYGGNYYKGSSGAFTNFQNCFIEHSHISYNQERPTVNYLNLLENDCITHYDNCFFHLGATADRDKAEADLGFFAYSTTGLPLLKISNCRFSNYKILNQFASEGVKVSVANNVFLNTIPFISNKRSNLFRSTIADTTATNINTFPDIYVPFFGAVAANIVSQYETTEAVITWDSIEKAFKIKKKGGAPSVNLVVKMETNPENYSVSFKVKTISGNGTLNAKLRYLTKRVRSILKVDNSIITIPDIVDSTYIKSVQDNITPSTSYVTFTDGFITPRPGYEQIVLSIELTNLTNDAEFYLKDVIFSKF